MVKLTLFPLTPVPLESVADRFTVPPNVPFAAATARLVVDCVSAWYVTEAFVELLLEQAETLPAWSVAVPKKFSDVPAGTETVTEKAPDPSAVPVPCETAQEFCDC